MDFLQKIAKRVFRKQTAIFLFFLFLSANFWLMHSIGSNKEIIVVYRIDYINLPNNVIITNSSQKDITVSLRDNKTSFLHYLFVKQTPAITIDLKGINRNAKAGQKTYSIDNIVENTIKKDFGQRAEIINFNPKVLIVEYSTLSSKKVPVILKGEIKVRNQYIISDSIIPTPQEVTIYGSWEKIKAIDAVEITDLNNDSLDKTTEIYYTLRSNKNITFSPKGINIKVPVEKSTEKNITVEIACKNAPNGLDMKAFPQEVNIVLLVPLSKFNHITANDLTAYVDYEKRSSDNKCIVELTSKDSRLKILRVSPQEVEFSLEEKSRPK